MRKQPLIIAIFPLPKSLLLLLLLALGACSSNKNDVRIQHKNAAINNLMSYARSLTGMPYKYGGNSPDMGFDCSGFVGHVFRHTLGTNLPRKTEEIRHVGKPVGMQHLRAGDLVFFNTLRRKFSHVGIYLGNGRFIHAPSNSGRVREENMRDDYWQRNYNGARRVTARR